MPFYICSAIIGYLLGSSNMAYYISKHKDISLKEIGSKNYGTSNTVAFVGIHWGILVLIHDILKSFLAVIISQVLFPELPFVGVVAGIFSVIGIFSRFI